MPTRAISEYERSIWDKQTKMSRNADIKKIPLKITTSYYGKSIELIKEKYINSRHSFYSIYIGIFRGILSLLELPDAFYQTSWLWVLYSCLILFNRYNVMNHIPRLNYSLLWKPFSYVCIVYMYYTYLYSSQKMKNISQLCTFLSLNLQFMANFGHVRC